MSGVYKNFLGIFADSALEQSFELTTRKQDTKANRIALAVFVTLFACYSFADLVFVELIQTVLVARFIGTLFGITGIMLLFSKKFRQYHSQITVASIVCVGCAFAYIIRIEASLENAYYVGFIQGAVFTCFLARVNFVYALTGLLAILISFAWSVENKWADPQASVQLIVLLTMFLICVTGNNVINRIRRDEFLQSQTIKKRNRQLSRLLREAEVDRRNKTAVTNILLHHLKSPIHQIIGFADITLNQSKEENYETGFASFENASEIKRAASGLNANMNRLLRYHRLGEGDLSNDDLHPLDELHDLITSDEEKEIRVNLIGTSEAKVPYYLFSQLGSTLCEYYRDECVDATEISIQSYQSETHDVFAFSDNSAVLGSEAFEIQINPLDEVKNYLGEVGDNWPMSLRTLCKLTQFYGGTFEYNSADNVNNFELKFPTTDAPKEKSERAVSAPKAA